jgi:hypothetical protein
LFSDDAVVLIDDVAEEQATVGFDNLMMVIRSDRKEPLQDLTDALAVARNQGDVHALALAQNEVGLALLKAVQMTSPVAADYKRDYAPLERLRLEQFAVVEGTSP